MTVPEEETETDKEKPKQGKGFFACYLLTSLCPRFKGRTYIGYTVNPRRRIRQHNGEITSGAFRTKKHRPWEMVLCIYGFPTNVSALQFEWAWQHPKESVAVRQAAAAFKTFSGVANKIKLAYTMLNLPPWQSLNIVVNYFSTNYTKHYAGCPSLPQHMKVQFRPMDELPCYSEADASSFQDEDVQYGWGEEEEDDEKVTNSSGSINMEELLHCPNSVPWDNSGEDSPFQGKDGKCDRYEEKQENNEANSKNISDITKVMQSDATSHISADCAISIKDASYEHFRRHEEHGNRQQWHPHATEADQVQPIGFLESLAKTKPLFLTTFSTVEAEVDRQQSIGFIDSPLFVTASSTVEIEDDRASPTNGTTQEMPSDVNIHVSAEYVKCIEERFSEHFSCYEHSKRQQMDPPMSVVDHNHPQPIDVLDSPSKETPAVATCLTPIQIIDDSPLMFNEDSFPSFDLLKSKRFTLKEAADESEPTYVGSGYQEIEVINLLSPSPECRIKSNNKKNRVSVFCPQIIDLT